jgi:hypothetical protein
MQRLISCSPSPSHPSPRYMYRWLDLFHGWHHHQEQREEVWDWGQNKKKKMTNQFLMGNRHGVQRQSSPNFLSLFSSLFLQTSLIYDAWERRRLNRLTELGYVGRERKSHGKKDWRHVLQRCYSNLTVTVRVCIKDSYFFIVESCKNYIFVIQTLNNVYE